MQHILSLPPRGRLRAEQSPTRAHAHRQDGTTAQRWSKCPQHALRCTRHLPEPGKNKRQHATYCPWSPSQMMTTRHPTVRYAGVLLPCRNTCTVHRWDKDGLGSLAQHLAGSTSGQVHITADPTMKAMPLPAIELSTSKVNAEQGLRRPTATTQQCTGLHSGPVITLHTMPNMLHPTSEWELQSGPSTIRALHSVSATQHAE
ncbi:hypothetical protein COO60DRAFT_1532373 [Scenedesmus sp. NREL 46B-D3]|nr:hypothetical protein COO60DRAFT_1532373 [Scenedesmus sp. NREL 46B-D3]